MKYEALKVTVQKLELDAGGLELYRLPVDDPVRAALAHVFGVE